MYVSRPVRAIRDNPEAGESVSLRVRAPGAVNRVRESVAELGEAHIKAEGQSDTVIVSVPERRVTDICSIEGVTVVETANVLGVDVGDAGEDVEPE